MTKYIVTIKRTITTDLEVEATSAVDACRLVKDYGLVEASSNFNVISVSEKKKINQARPLEEPPYPFCRSPEKCGGWGYCRNDPACND